MARAREDRRARRPRSFVWRLRRPGYLLALVALAGLSAAVLDLSRIELPDAEPLRETSFVCAADVQFGECRRSNSLAQLSGEQDRVLVTYDQLPDVLVLAVIAAEDQDFFTHSGIDPLGVLRAAVANLREQDVVQGGSSITQQYVKNVFLTDERSLERKLKEAVLAIKLEKELSKEEILERYLNTIYFGRGAYGVQAASRAYFGKDVEDLDLADAAYLAGLIRAPEAADGNRGVDDARAEAERAEATRRRTQVLAAMVGEGYITDEQRDRAAGIPFEEPYVKPRGEASNFGSVRDAQFGSEYFVEYVRRFLTTEGGFTDKEVFGGGLRVYTTLDHEMQRAAFDAVNLTLDQPADPAGALVAVDESGRVMAMVGGTDWSTSQVNLAVGREGGGTGRQPGSSFKPFVLATALEQGISVESFFDSKPQVVLEGANAGANWVVSNYGLQEHGPIDLVEATRVSSNTAYAQLMLEVGAENAAATAQAMGIRSDVPAVNSLVLGAGEVSVLDMASAYSTFGRGGVRVDPIVVTRVEDPDGNVLRSYGPQRERVVSELTAQTVSWALAQVVSGGTGTGAQIAWPAAGKTGTTEEYRDAWFAGYTCKLTAAVWVGFDTPDESGAPRYMTDVRGDEVTGGSLPADIWRRFMQRAMQRWPDECTSGFFEPYTFAGEILNPELATTTTSTTSTTTTETTTTTVDPSGTTTTVDPSGTTTTVDPSGTTTTTVVSGTTTLP